MVKGQIKWVKKTLKRYFMRSYETFRAAEHLTKSYYGEHVAKQLLYISWFFWPLGGSRRTWNNILSPCRNNEHVNYSHHNNNQPSLIFTFLFSSVFGLIPEKDTWLYSGKMLHDVPKLVSYLSLSAVWCWEGSAQCVVYSCSLLLATEQSLWDKDSVQVTLDLLNISCCLDVLWLLSLLLSTMCGGNHCEVNHEAMKCSLL